MTKLVRFGVSLEDRLLSQFDRDIKEKNYPTRSKAIGDLIRESLVKKEWDKGSEVTGAITLVYDHHKRELVNKLMDIQHDFGGVVIASQHVHLDHHNCLEVVIVKGKAAEVDKLSNKLKAVKGVKHGSLSMTTTGKGMS